MIDLAYHLIMLHAISDTKTSNLIDIDVFLEWKSNQADVSFVNSTIVEIKMLSNQNEPVMNINK